MSFSRTPPEEKRKDDRSVDGRLKNYRKKANEKDNEEEEVERREKRGSIKKSNGLFQQTSGRTEKREDTLNEVTKGVK
jgi:hypothetical protein